jgi:serine phosphatase RsbU (regulator of sigma subunit)
VTGNLRKPFANATPSSPWRRRFAERSSQLGARRQTIISLAVTGAKRSLSDHLLALSIGDVCGHGIDASNQMIAIREVLEAAAHELRDPAKILARANTLAYELVQVMPVTGIVALFDALANTLTFANAGHPPPLMVGPCGQMFLARYPADIPLGITADHAATSYVVPVPPETLLVFYTDGVTEHQRDPITGEEQLRLAAAHTYRYPQGNTAQTIARRVLSGDSSPDDAAILTIRRPALINAA